MINKEQHVFLYNLGLIALMNSIIALGLRLVQLTAIHSCYYSQIALKTMLLHILIIYLFSVNTFTPIERCAIIFVIAQVGKLLIGQKIQKLQNHARCKSFTDWSVAICCKLY